jgi:hypothetical protein
MNKQLEQVLGKNKEERDEIKKKLKQELEEAHEKLIV